MLLFGFAEGQELSEYTSTAQALIQVLLESCELSLDGLPHVVKATEKFPLLLTLPKPAEPTPGLSRVKAAVGVTDLEGGVTIMTEATITLDVRDDIRVGRGPFSRIMEATAQLKEGESLRLIVPFEPVPLFDVMARRGFSHESRRTNTGDWDVLFARPPKSDAPGSRKPKVRDEEKGDQRGDLGDTELRPASLLCVLPTSVLNPSVPGKTPAPPLSGVVPVLDVDARGLEPPQPLVVILEALERLPEGAAMRACTDRRPMHLYAQLEQRGFTGETEEQHDGSFITTIRRA